MNGLLTRQTYGNGDKVEFTYDILGRAKTTTYKDENNNIDRVLTYVYTGDGQLYSIHDSRTGFLYLYTYDSIGRLIASSVKNSDGEVLMSARQEYDADNRMTGQHWTVGTTTYSETYTYSTADGALTSYNNALGETIRLNYDELRRLSTVTGGPYERKYNYKDVPTGDDPNRTTSLVSGYHYKGANGLPVYSFSYTYDVLGNIASYTDASGTQVYTYDDQNQLTKVRKSGVVVYEYTYDNAGNIQTAYDGTTTHTYRYDNTLWQDLLTAYDGNYIAYEGQTISNGVVSGTPISGNPISYYNGTRYDFTWEEGRRLTSTTVNGKTYTYTYDSNGIRTSKTVDGVTHNYIYASGKLLRETYGNVTLDFLYDNSGYPYALIYKNGTAATQTYYYITNLQGDVLYLLDSDKQEVASYTYDPYGKVLTTTGEMADINPLRYRGYYYDAETGFYYVSSRYLDARICRWINSDDAMYLGANGTQLSLNLFAYCLNNPVMLSDPNGHAPEWWQWAISGAMIVAGVVMVATGVGGIAGGTLICAGANSILGSYTSEASGGSSTAGWAGGMLTGAICGAGAGTAGKLLINASNSVGVACIGNLAAGYAVAFGSGFAGSTIGQLASCAIDGREVDLTDIARTAVATGSINILSGLGSAVGTAMQDLSAFSTTTIAVANSLNVLCTLVTESICDSLGVVSTLFP